MHATDLCARGKHCDLLRSGNTHSKHPHGEHQVFILTLNGRVSAPRVR